MHIVYCQQCNDALQLEPFANSVLRNISPLHEILNHALNLLDFALKIDEER